MAGLFLDHLKLYLQLSLQLYLVATVANNCSVDKSVLILSQSPYKDQNPKIGPYLVLISEI